MTDVAILVPVLARPHRVAPLLDSIVRSTRGTFRVLFIVDPTDYPEHEAIREAGAEMLVVDGGYAAKINAGVHATSEPLIFTGADDIVFVSGWLRHSAAAVERGASVVGVNDLLQRRRERHATHFLLTREYAERPCVDDSPGPLFEGYDHSFVDDELIATATKRGVYVYEPGAIVEHRHWMNGLAPDDEVYVKGRAHFRQDRRTFLRRSHLWA